MAELYIHIPGGEQLSIVPEASSSQDWALMGDNKLSLSFQRYECLILPAGAWCEFDGVIFYLLQEYKPTMIHSHLWQYNVAFVDGASWLGVTTALKTIDGEDAPLFTLTAPAAEHAAIIVSNLNRRLGTTVWEVGSVIDTPNITIEYTGKYCGAVLQEIVDDQNTEWWVDGTTLNIGRAEFGSLIELGYRDGLLGDITVTHADNMSSYRTLYPVGSTRNILPTEYGHDRLQLPNGQKSVMMNPAGVAELVEEAAFAGIYPRYKGKVTGVSTSIGQSNDGSQYLIYYVADTAIPFNPNEYEMPGLVKRITFQSGELMGAEFEVNYNPASKEFELITQFQENGSQLPGGMLIPQVGDEYVVWNISMPAEYYPLAEQELLEAAESFAAASTRESNVYKVKLDYIDVQERGLSLRPGQKVRLHSLDYFPEQGYYDSRITRVTRPVNYPGEYTIDVSAVRVVGSLTRLQTSLAAATTKVNSLSNTVQTVVQTVSNAVTLTGNQRVQGVKNFVDGIRVNGSPVIEYDPVINAWLFRGNILAEGGMAAFSNIKGFTPSTITDAVLIDNRTIKRGADGLMYVDLNEVGGGGSGGGSVDPSQLEAYLKPYAKTADVASTYATIASLSAVTSRLNDFLSGSDTDAIINKWSELETFLAGLAETDNLATILSGKANKATTLAGYGITDAYTKSHIDSNFVTIGTKQQITGEKDFVGGFKVNGGLVEYNATLKAWVLNGDLLVTGGVSAFSNISGFKPSTITEAVLIDNKTIKRNADGLLYAVAQETDGINEDQLADYLTTKGYITGITLSMVTNALGYTPLSTGGGTITGEVTISCAANTPLKINSNATDSGICFNHNGAAKTRVGFEASRGSVLYHSAGSHRLGINNDGVAFYDSNTLLHSGNYSGYALPKDGTAVAASKLATIRSIFGQSFDGSADVRGNIFPINTSGCYYNEDGISYHTNKQYQTSILRVTSLYNVAIGGTTASEKLHVYGNILATGTVSGAGGKFADNVSIAEGKNIMMRSANAQYYAGIGYDTSGNECLALWAKNTVTRLRWSAGVDFSAGITAGAMMGITPDFEISKATGAAIGYIAGNTILHSGNYSKYALPLTGGTVNGDVYSKNYRTDGVVYIQKLRIENLNEINGYSDYNGGLAKGNVHLNYASSGIVTLCNGGGNCAVGGISASEKLHIYGNLLATGGVTATNSSDKRLKRNLRKFNASKVLMSLGGVWEYEYVDSEVQKNHIYEGTHYGLIYQYVKGTALDVMCHEREDGMGALNYLHPKFISLIAGATMENISEVEKLKRKIRHLEQKVKQLEQRA